MSQHESSEIAAGAIGTLKVSAGGAMMYGTSLIGDALTPPVPLAENAAHLADVMAAVPTAGFAAGAAVAAWGVIDLAWRFNGRGRVRAKYNNPGWAGPRALKRQLSHKAAMKIAEKTRPSYKVVKWYNRPWYLNRFTKQFQPTDHGVYLGKSVVGPTFARRVYAAYRDVILVLAPPQAGKTAWLCGALIDAAGAVVATSTKADIYELTHLLRREGDRPVLLFNPSNLGDLESTVRFNVVRGCDVPAVAKRRARDLVQGTRSMSGDAGRHPDADFWDSNAAKVLRCQLLAAALENHGMDTVARWATSPTDQTALEILHDHPDRVPEAWLFELRQVLDMPDRTRDSIFLTLSQAVEFMAHAGAAQIAMPGPGEDALDIDTFVRGRGTLYILGDDRSLAPLIVALTQHLFEGAKDYAAKCPSGRLDPPVSFILDEAALIVPVDLVRWVADAGGRNISIVISAQAMAQLYALYGERGGEVIRNSSNTELIFGSLKMHQELKAISEGCGTYKTLQVTHTDSANAAGPQGSRSSTSKVEVIRPIIEPAQLREIPENHVLIMHRTAPPTMVRTTPVWERRDVKKALRRDGKSVKDIAKRITEQIEQDELGQEPQA